MGFVTEPEFWEYVGEGLVFVGVVLEVVCERKLIFKRDDNRREHLEASGGWILIAGLAVSLTALVGTNERFNGTIASLNLQAQQAGERAAKDELLAAEARKKAELLERQIADATARTKEAEAKVASAEASSKDAVAKVSAADARIAEAERGTAAANLETARLEAQIQPRSYTAAEISLIKKACKSYAGTPVFMRSMPYDVEGAVFGIYLAQILQSEGCGLKVNISGVGDNFMQNLPMFMDVHVTGPADKQALMNALAGALNTPQVRAVAETPTQPAGTPVRILVGAKRLTPK